MAITPVVPTAYDQMVDQTQQIIVDFTAAATSLTINTTTVIWDNVSGFQNGWSGNYISHSGGYRLACTPPSPYTQGATYKVIAQASGETLTYIFRVALKRLTTTKDLASPRLIKAGSYWWTARAHLNDGVGLPPQFDGPGNIYLQVVDPASAEVLTVPGKQVGLVYDEARSKVIIYFVRHGTIYWMEADPADTPTTQSQLRSLTETLGATPVGAGVNSALTSVNYPPIKRAITEPMIVPGPVGQGVNELVYGSPYDAAPTPAIVSGTLTDNFVQLRIQRPAVSQESLLLVGYHIVKYFMGTPNVIGFASMAPSDVFVDFIDPTITPGASYAVMPEYWRYIPKNSIGTPLYDERSPISEISIAGVRARLETYSAREYMSVPGAVGAGVNSALSGVTYPPVKRSVVETLGTPPVGAGVMAVWSDSSFPPIGP